MFVLLALLFVGPVDCAPAPSTGRESTCEVRTFSLDARESLTIRNPVSGSVQVVAWDRDEIGVRAEVRAYKTDGRSPEALLAATEIQTSGDEIAPRTAGGGWVETRFIVSVPRHMDLDLSTNNGAITVEGVAGTLRIDTNNGAVRLSGVGGDVSARSNNGHVTIDLRGETWEGSGLKAFANNGTLRLFVPETYSAILEADVRWGYINSPDALSPAKASRRVYVGAGGPTLTLSVNAGSVQIERG